MGNNATEDLQHIVQLTNISKSETAKGQLMKVAENATKVHFKLELNRVPSKFNNKKHLYGLHSVHDEDGNVLEWNSKDSKYDGTPAYMVDENGNTVYKESTITLYRNHIAVDLNNFKQEKGDGVLTTEEMMVEIIAHEIDHNTNQEAIDAVAEKQKGNKSNFNEEIPARKIQKKVYEEIKQNRGK